MTTQPTEQNILKAFNEGCSDVKNTLKILYPDLFPDLIKQGDWVIADLPTDNFKEKVYQVIEVRGKQKFRTNGAGSIKLDDDNTNCDSYWIKRKATDAEISAAKEKLIKLTPIQQVINKIGNFNFNDYSHIHIDNNNIQIPLPHDNIQWTFAAFDYIKKFVTEAKNMGFTCYPIHLNTNGRVIQILCREK